MKFGLYDILGFQELDGCTLFCGFVINLQLKVGASLLNHRQINGQSRTQTSISLGHIKLNNNIQLRWIK